MECVVGCGLIELDVGWMTSSLSTRTAVLIDSDGGRIVDGECHGKPLTI